MKKKSTLFLFVVCIVLLLTSFFVWAAGALTPEIIVNHVNKAVQLVVDKGESEAFKMLTDPNGGWVDGELYVFIYDFGGTIVAHLNKKLEGKNMLKVKDIKGSSFAAEFIQIAKSTAGEGWCEYWWPKPNEKEASLKASYIKRVPGKELLIGVGTYEFSADQARKATGKP
ncbi:MAG: cache domain-containing protein [Desulfobacterales bacterium]|nr:cache domain-containing protein [Desulfobacterales bacterium]